MCNQGVGGGMSLLTDLGEHNKGQHSGPIFRLSLAPSLSVEGDDTDLPWQEAGRGEETSALSEEPVRVCALGPMVQLQGLRCQHLDLICNERRGGSFHFPRLRQLKFKNK